MTNTPDPERRRRIADCREAIRENHGLSWLAARWKVTVPAALQWVRRNLDERDYFAIRDNGVIARRPNPYMETGARLRMIATCRRAGLRDYEIAAGMGISASGLSVWLRRNAPDGVEDALQDFTDEDETAEAA